VPVTFEDFFYAERRSLLAQAYVLTGSSDDAQDLVQEVFLRAWTKWDEVARKESPAAWARTVLQNLVIGRWRRGQVEIRHSKRTPLRSDVEDQSTTFDLASSDLAGALRRLPEKERIALVLYHVVGLPVSEVASEMSAPEGTVRSWLVRGRLSLAKTLGVSDPDLGTSHSGKGESS
jgi:RNA polymerase sigma-70 factor (sigma-E family)